MKTPQYQRARDLIKDLNDAQNYIDFAFEAVQLDLGRFGPALDERFMPDVFANNSMAHRVNVRVSEAPAYFKESAQTTLRAYFVFVLSAIELYIKQTTDELSGIRGRPLSKDNDILNVFSDMVAGQDADSLFGLELWQTMTYLRQRRNCYVHNAGKVDGTSLSNTIDLYGAILNAYWAAQSRAQVDLDFTSKNILVMTAAENFVVFNLARICLDYMDGLVLYRYQGGLILLYEKEILSRRGVEIPRRAFYDREEHFKKLVAAELAFTDAEAASYHPGVI